MCTLFLLLLSADTCEYTHAHVHAHTTVQKNPDNRTVKTDELNCLTLTSYGILE